jgi:transposase-like protein
LWVGDGGEGAKFWLAVLTEIKNRGAADVCVVVCDGLEGLPEAVTTVWDRAIVQTCVIHYPDIRIMPTSRVSALVEPVPVGRMSA